MGLSAKVGVTPMIGVNDTSAEVFTTGNASTVESFAASNGIQLLAFWALGRDNQGASGTPQSTYQFTNIFMAATNSIPVLTNDVLWVCTNTAWTIIGSNTVRQSGEALFATQRRAPLSLRVSTSGTLSNRVNSATVRYDDNP